MEKKVFIVSNYDTENSMAVKLTEDQMKAIDWFIGWADVDCAIDTPENSAEDIT